MIQEKRNRKHEIEVILRKILNRREIIDSREIHRFRSSISNNSLNFIHRLVIIQDHAGKIIDVWGIISFIQSMRAVKYSGVDRNIYSRE